MIHTNSRWFHVVLLASLTLAGCGDGGLPRGEVSGVATLNGKPLTGGVVYFVPEKGPAASGVLDANGRYQLTTHGQGSGAVVGKHTVYFSPIADESHMAAYTEADYLAGKPPPAAPKREFVPDRFLSPSTSGLAAQVAGGSNTHDLPIVSP